MVRRFISTVALVACAGIYAFAAERATFILTSGERKSGTIVFHGGLHENLINGDLNLGQDNARDLTFHMDQVAVIDFVGGRPAVDELSQVPDSGHFLVLKDGNTQNGMFINMIGGDTLIWRNQDGQQQQYALRDVRRIYLNPDSARIAYRYRGTPYNAVGTAGQPPAIRVDANVPWTDTGVDVNVGDLVRFRASGEIAFGRSNGQMAGVDGKSDVQSPNYPVSVMPVGGLIAKVANSAPFPIGSNQQPIRMPASGRLMLGVNDNEVSDNSGFFSVIITRTGQNRYRGTPDNPVGTAGQTPAIRVDANVPWTDTGVDVRVGDLVRFRASGEIAFGRSDGQMAGVDGKSDVQSPNYPVSVMPVGGLIAKVANSAPFPIGSNQQPIRMPASGRLMLGVNDNEVSDNSGFFSVIVSRTGQNR